MIEFITNDIVTGSTEGIHGHKPDVSRLKIFLDLVSFSGDFPGAAALTDVVGHVGNACCTLCSFTRRKWGRGASILYSSDIHCRRLGYSRFDRRSIALRSNTVPCQVRRVLGMEGNGSSLLKKLPFVYLSEELHAHSHKVP